MKTYWLDDVDWRCCERRSRGVAGWAITSSSCSIGGRSWSFKLSRRVVIQILQDVDNVELEDWHHEVVDGWHCGGDERLEVIWLLEEVSCWYWLGEHLGSDDLLGDCLRLRQHGGGHIDLHRRLEIRVVQETLQPAPRGVAAGRSKAIKSITL